MKSQRLILSMFHSRYNLCFGFFLLFALGQFSCAKPHLEARENFSLAGYVYDCTAGLPVAGATIKVEARQQTSGMGFFGPTTGEAGNTVTDQNGYYELIPYKYDFTAEFRITVIQNGTEKGYIGVAKAYMIIGPSISRYLVDTICTYP